MTEIDRRVGFFFGMPPQPSHPAPHSLAFAYPDEHAPTGLPGVLPLPKLAEPVAIHRAAQAGTQAAGIKLIPLSEEGAIALQAGGLVPLRRVDRVAQWSSLMRRRGAHITDDLLLADVLPRTIPAGPMVPDPPWQGDTWLKNAFSTLSLGVERLESCSPVDIRMARSRILERARPHHDLVRALTGEEPARSWLIQEHIEGPQFEANLVVADGAITMGPMLLQHWHEGKIVKYEPIDEPALREIAVGIVRAIRATWAFVCLEIRLGPEGWKIIELHLRPGDDSPAKGYPVGWVAMACRLLLDRWAATMAPGMGAELAG